MNPEKEKTKITRFLKKIFTEQNIENAVIGLSGGIDSTVVFYLLKGVLPPEHIFSAHLYYFKPVFESIAHVGKAMEVPEENIQMISIKEPVDAVTKTLFLNPNESQISPRPSSRIESGVGSNRREYLHKIRLGNIAARLRMTVLFDLAKKVNGLVCGTENRSENLLGYFTRFGDQASDIEPIAHLYKTQVYQLAQHLGVPEEIIKQSPTAGLWQGQTDEGEFGFTYDEADQVLHLFFDEQQSVEKIEQQGFKNAKIIIDWTKRNMFKHEVPYHL